MKLLSMSGGGVIVGLNAALQKRFVLPSSTPLIPGNVHRISDVQVGVGGKGQDVSIALACLGYENQKIAQFLGTGPEGDQVYALLQERLGRDAMSLTVRSKTTLRTCTSVVASDTTTELIEPSGVIDQDEMKGLLTLLDQLDAASAVCIMGSMPPGCDDSTYAQIYQKSANADTVCVIDSVAGLPALLEQAQRGKTIFKVNASELCTLAQVPKRNNEVDGIHPQELVAAIQGFLNRYPTVTAIAITDGKHPAHLAVMDDHEKASFSLYQLPVHPLPDDKTLFPIGAGDAVAAGTLAAWQCLLETQQQQEEESSSCLPQSTRDALTQYQAEMSVQGEASAMLVAFSFGLACGSASCLQEENSVLDTQDVLRIFRKGKPAFLSKHS